MKNMDDRPFYAQQIIEYRKLAGLTQKQLAIAANIPLGTIKTIESGATNPSFTMLYKIAKALNTSPDSFMSIDSRFDGTLGLEFYKKEFAKIKKLIPKNFLVEAGGIPEVGFDEDLDIIYHPEQITGEPAIVRHYNMISLVDDVASIKENLSQKYNEELRKEIKNLLFKLLAEEHEELFPPLSSDVSYDKIEPDPPKKSKERKKLGD